MSNPLHQIIDGKRYHEISYDAKAVFEMLTDIKGVRDLRGGVDGAGCNAEYHSELGWTYVELSDDCRGIVMSHSDDVALQLAIEINNRYRARYGASLEISDSSWTFHQKLEGIETLEDLHESIRRSPFIE